MAIPPPCDRFFNNLNCMKEPLLTAIAQSGIKSDAINADLLQAAFGFLSFMPKQDLLDTFIVKTNEHWELIGKCSEVEPILDAVLGSFDALGEDRMKEIKKIVKEKNVNPEIQTKLLNLGRSLVKIAIRELEARGGSTTIDVPKMAAIYGLAKK